MKPLTHARAFLTLNILSIGTVYKVLVFCRNNGGIMENMKLYLSGCVKVKIHLHKGIHPILWTPSLVLNCSGPHFPCGPHLQCNAFSLGNSFIIWCWISHIKTIQGNNYEIVINFFHISHNFAWYSAIVHKFTRI